MFLNGVSQVHTIIPSLLAIINETSARVKSETSSELDGVPPKTPFVATAMGSNTKPRCPQMLPAHLGLLPQARSGEGRGRERLKRSFAGLGNCFSSPLHPLAFYHQLQHLLPVLCKEWLNSCSPWSFTSLLLGSGLAQHTGKEQGPESTSVLNGQMCDQCCIQKAASCPRVCLRGNKCCVFELLRIHYCSCPEVKAPMLN